MCGPFILEVTRMILLGGGRRLLATKSKVVHPRVLARLLLSTTILGGSTHPIPVSFFVAGYSSTGITTRRRLIMPPHRRRSSRISGLSAVEESDNNEVVVNSLEELQEPPTKKKRSTRSSSPRSVATKGKTQKEDGVVKKTKKKAFKKDTPKKDFDDSGDEEAATTKVDCLPRTRELQILSNNDVDGVKFVMGIDEAGRGPLAGPVVAAACICPTDIGGIVDSKKVVKEEDREALFEQIVALPDVSWAVAIIDANRIDQINILQATLEGMRLCASALANNENETLTTPSYYKKKTKKKKKSNDDDDKEEDGPIDDICIPIVKEASIEDTGCYVVKKKASTMKGSSSSSSAEYYALIDGNKIPQDMPCESESIVKGDSKEFAIAAASILAKVTRDRLMHAYDEKYPEYNLAQHKGYPTAHHMSTVTKLGPTPIHRLTFAPLKHMEFDDN